MRLVINKTGLIALSFAVIVVGYHFMAAIRKTASDFNCKIPLREVWQR